MKILDIINGPWAIEPSRLLEIQSIYSTHVQGGQIDLAAVEARLGRPLANEHKSYQVIDGVAVLPISGVLGKKLNMLAAISGGSSMQMIANDLRAAVDDPSVHSIILSVDSPGGTVDGTQALSDLVRSMRDSKPIVTLADGEMCSAAYWIGSAASAAYVADGTTTVGSIGVVTAHKDISAAETARGIKTTELTAGKYKRIASQFGPLTAEGQQSIQEKLDYAYSLFVAGVAQNLGVSEDKVLADMADGRTFMGQQAVDAGLVVGTMTLDQLVAKLNADRKTVSPRASMARKSTVATNKGTTTMLTAEQVASEHPDIAAAFRAEGASAELARIQGVEGQLIPGHEALIHKLKFDGKSTAGDAAQAVLAAEKAARTSQAAALANDAPDPVKQEPAANPVKTDAAAGQPMTRAELDAKAKAYVKANPGTDYVTAVSIIEQQGA